MLRGLLKFLSIMAFLVALYYIRYYLSYWDIQKHSQFFVTDTVSTIGQSWSVKDFEKIADAALKSPGAIESAFAAYRKLGSIARPASCDLKDFNSYKYQGTSMNYISAVYECKAEFTNGPATLELTIVRYQDADAWKIFEFHVYSPYFLSKR